MNFYTQKQRLGPFDEYTVYKCIFLSYAEKRTAHSLTPRLHYLLPENHSVADTGEIFDLVLAVFSMFHKTDWNPPKAV